jgi:hypothetical protein
MQGMFKFCVTLFLSLLFFFYQPLEGDLGHGAIAAEDPSPSLAFSTLAAQINPQMLRVLEQKYRVYQKNLKEPIATLIDFSLPSTQKRLWLVNLESGEILLHTYVAHGRNSGGDLPQDFSNVPQSFQSSLGFYLTDQVYQGKHGRSMRLKGLEKGINDKAMERAIVVHGADYVSEDFIKNHGRLGRSQGCPALPRELTDVFIDQTREGTLLFIFHPRYLEIGS